MVSISMARAALPENGLTSAVGRASTKRVSMPSSFHAPADGIQHIAQRTRGAKHPHGAQHGHQVGQQALGHIKTLFGAVDKRLVHGHLAPGAHADKQHHQRKQREVAQQRRQLRQRRRAQRGQQRHEACQCQGHRQQIGQHHRAEQGQPLHRRHAEQPHQRGGRRGQQNGQEHQRRVGRALLHAVHEDGDRQQRERRGVEHQKQNLRVGGGVGLGFSSCSARMAFRPMGVAALSSPSALAAKFSVIRPRAGWPRGTPGISRANSGASQRARAFTMPAFSAMRKKPSHSVSVPNSSTITSTDSLAMANRASTMAAKIWALHPPAIGTVRRWLR
jgi:hypothetical protein